MRVIRAGKRVCLNSGGESQFPNLIGKTGLLKGYNAPFMARVLFEGYSVAILLHCSFLREVLDGTQKPESPSTKRRREALERRRLIRAAFDVIRHDPGEKETVRMLAGALGGSVPVTSTIFETASEIVREKNHAATPPTSGREG